MIHELKTWPEPFEETRIGNKKTEIRAGGNAAPVFNAGDVLRLREYDPLKGYSGRMLDVAVRRISKLWETPPEWHIRAPLVVMEIERLREHSNPRRHEVVIVPPPFSENT